MRAAHREGDRAPRSVAEAPYTGGRVAERHSLFDTITDSIVPIHNDGYKFLAIGAGVSLLLFLLWPPLAWLAVLVTAWIAYFFRDPARVTPLREGLVVAPATGASAPSSACARPPSWASARPSACASRSSSRSSTCTSTARRWRAASSARSTCRAASSTPPLDKASEENERRGIVIDTAGDSEIAMVQIAGLIARRIVTFVNEGDSVGVGERVGLIRFGSRVDLYLPPGRGALVAVGQRAIGGETVLADLKSSEPEREARAQ